MSGIKHLIECHCTLKIYEGREDIQDHIFHKFTVYSQIDDKGNIVEKLVQCNNCNTTHKVYDYCKSELVNLSKDETNTMIDIDDIKIQLEDKIVNVLNKYDVDIATWEQVLDICDKKEWGSQVVIAREVINQKYHVKILIIEEVNKIKIISKVIEDEIN